MRAEGVATHNQVAHESSHLIKNAKRAVEENRPHDARSLLQQAARQSPDDPRVWLLLAGVASSSRAREAYLARAAALRRSATVPPEVITVPPPTMVHQRSRWATWAARGGILLLCIVLLAAGGAFLWSYWTGQPVAAVVARWLPADEETQTADPILAEEVAAAADTEEEAQPTPTLIAEATAIAELPVVEDEEAPVATEIAAVEESADEVAAADPLVKNVVPDSQPRPAWTPTLAPTPTPEPTATPEPVVAGSAVRPAEVGAGEKWIDVNLSTQTLVAYEGDTPVLNTLISSGTWQFPTVTGQYRTYAKYESQTMNGYLLGYDYYLEGVPFVMYFYRDYAIHGTFWHNNFGTPMSHGCVNMKTEDAGWLYHWAPMGTLVSVHY